MVSSSVSPEIARREPSNRLNVIAGRGKLSHHDQLIVQTRKWVATAFFEPMLAEMRNSPFHSDLMEGGTAGKTYESMFDERLSEKMASDASDTLVKSIVRKIEGARQYAKTQRSTQQAIDREREGADRVKAMTGANHVAAYY